MPIWRVRDELDHVVLFASWAFRSGLRVVAGALLLRM